MAKSGKLTKMLRKAGPYREYGPDYDRNIDSAARDLEDAIRAGRSTGTWSDVLQLRLEKKALDEALGG